MKILVVEDEPKVAAFLEQGLNESGYSVSLAFDGQTGLNLALSQNFDAIILDINLPFISGLEICKTIKNQKNVPILMLTALGLLENKLAGFEQGADDYLVKPFEFRELLARINALSRRNYKSTVATENLLQVADLILNLDSKKATRNNIEIDLTAKEFTLLELFIRNKGRVLSRVDIAEKVWEINFDTGTNVIDVYVNFLRKKIDKNFDKKLIHTQIGMGYILKEI